MFERTRTSLYGAAPDQRAGRDLRLDLFRGLSLLFIFIDHIPNNVLSYMTLHSIAFSDAAEVFVFISGYAAATVYGKALARQGPIAAAGHIYRRVWQLYVAHILLFVAFSAQVAWVSEARGSIKLSWQKCSKPFAPSVSKRLWTPGIKVRTWKMRNSVL